MVLASLASESLSQASDQDDDTFADEGGAETSRSSKPRRWGLKKNNSKRQTIRSSSLRFVDKFVRANFAPVHRDYRYEQLQQIEKRRRDVLSHVEEPIWKILCIYDGTVVQILLYDALFWLTISLYVGIRIVAVWELPSYLDDVPADSISALGGVVTFFLVFWVNQNNNRFFGQYENSMACKGHVISAATLAVTSLPPEKAKRLIRYMNCAHAAGYVGLSEVYPTGSYFDYINKTMGLLTDQERDRLEDIDIDKGGSAAREVISWCMNETQQAEKQNLINPMLAKDFRDHILGLQSNLSKLYNAKDLPIPFFYVHFICLLTTLYLPLFGVTSAIQAGTGEDVSWINGVIRGLTVVLQSVFVIGLRVLGQKMSDPFGDDLIDLSVMYYIHFTWQMSNRVLNSCFPEAADPAVEESLMKGRENLGDAWDPPEPTGRKSFYFDAMDESLFVTEGTMAASSDSRIIPNPRPKKRATPPASS